MEAVKLKQKQVDQKKENDHFIIDNDQKANWALRKIRHLKQKKKENQDFADTEIEAIQKEIDEVGQKTQKRINELSKQAQDMLADYRAARDETANLRVYNEQLQRQVES